MYRPLAFTILCLLFARTSLASIQEKDEYSQIKDSLYIHPQEVLLYDKAPIEARTLDKNLINKFKQDGDLDYTDATPKDNVWSRFKAWLSDLWSSFLQGLFGVDEAVGFWAVLIELLPYISIGMLIALLVWIFLKIDSATLLGERIKTPAVLLSNDEELIRHEDLESLIKKALSDKNYRLAIRYYYLLILQKMSAKELINWQVQKTNYDYLLEINEQELREQFKTVTDLYDYIWYGNFEVDETAFAKAETSFKILKNTL